MCITLTISSQNRFSISGIITDSKNGETLSGATISIEEQVGTGTVSNTYGFYAINLYEGKYTLKVQYLGYQSVTTSIVLNQNINLNIKMESQATALQEIEVVASDESDRIHNNIIGVEKLKISEIKDIPVFFGEHDILKTITLTPGITSVRDGLSGIHVRGGDNAQNLILLDETTVYYPYHVMGLFSTFNNEAVKDITVYKGTAPAAFGGRVSSIMDIQMKDGNNQAFEVNGGIGLIASNIAVEGPIVKDKASFLLTGRRTYIDQLLKLSGDPELSSNAFNFYDVNAKLSFKLNNKNRIFFSAYQGRDALKIPNHLGLSWGNRTASFRWNHIWNNQVFSNTSLHYSDFDYTADFEFEPSTFSLYSGLQDISFKHEFQFFLGKNSRLRIGYDLKTLSIKPGQLIAAEDAVVHPLSIENRKGREHATYFSNEIKPSPNWIIDFGVRINFFNLIGPGTYYNYIDGEVSDSTIINTNKTVKTYFTPERRISLSHIINHSNSIKMAYSTHSQHIHKISTADASLPIDIWVMSSKNIKPELSDQLSLGYYASFNQAQYQFSVETYFKWVHDALDLRNGANIKANEHIEGELLDGHGRAYGLELLFKKRTGKLHGWIAYNLSKTELSIKTINDGNWYPARYDMPHDFSIVALYDISKTITFSANWIYQTGNAVTFPSGKYEIDGETHYFYDNRNADRMPDYHRLDLGLTWNIPTRGRYKHSINFSVYNAYARKNAFAIDFKEDPDGSGETIALMTYLFTALPSINYNFHF